MRHDVPVSTDEPVSKVELRQLIRATRRDRTEDERRRAATALAGHVHELLPNEPGHVAAYLSMPTEPSTGPLIDAVREAGHAVLVPRVTDERLEWVALEDEVTLVDGPMGIREPLGAAGPSDTLASVDLLLLPGLAVDGRGRRLGQGGGFYDRALTGVPAHADGGPLRVIVLFDDEVVDEVPTESHDCRVDAALTPLGLLRLV
jgi:5-formyltetrahydrofolate cyclo-ligase